MSTDEMKPKAKIPKPYQTGYWEKSCDYCKHSEPNYCLLYDRVMKNMDCKRCSSWEEKEAEKP